jgi:acyl-coenzyme A synthetase/AMP-(fatty) acid ligase
VVTTAYTITDDTEGALPPIGVPISGVEVMVIDNDLYAVRDGEPGELYIGGRGLALGYLHDHELTAKRFVSLPGRQGRWYRSGDAVTSHDGVLHFQGRVDLEELKVRGMRVAAAEIEAAILTHPGVRAAATTVVGHGIDSVLVAVIAAVVELSGESLRLTLRSRLPATMVPNRLLFVDRLPLTANGKVDRRAVALMAAESAHT